MANSSGEEQDEIVSSFLKSIFTAASSQASDSVGLIYAYEWPAGTYQLCDGQQRVTTLFLLAGELYRRLQEPGLKSVLIRHDDIHTEGFSALQYGIRETSLNFLDSLVREYFLQPEVPNLKWRQSERERYGALEPAHRPDWYFAEYDHDPTIQAMLCALAIIDEKIPAGHDQLAAISDYILRRMSFIFYDMESRTKGEDTFVIINNTGQPLTSVENLKPKLIGSAPDERRHDFVIEWEAREDFFWRHKDLLEQTSDDLSRDFYHWHSVIEKGYELEDIQATFEAFKKFYAYFVDENTRKYNGAEVIFSWEKTNSTFMKWLREEDRQMTLLPMLAYLKKFRAGTEIELRDELFMRGLLRAYLDKKYALHQDKQSSNTVKSLIALVKQATEPAQAVAPLLEGCLVEGDDDFNLHELREIELNLLLRMNTEVLFDGEPAREQVMRRFENLKYLSQLGKDRFAQEHISDSNLYRLLRVFKDWGGDVRHQYYRSSWCEGRNVNNLSDEDYVTKYRTIYRDSEFKQLLDSEPSALGAAIRQQVVGHVKADHSILGINEENFTPARYLKAWIYAKVLMLGVSNRLMSTYNEILGAVKELQGNKLWGELGLSVANSCACYVRGTGQSFYRADEEHYVIENLDSPLFDKSVFRYGEWESGSEADLGVVEDKLEGVMEELRRRHAEFVEG